MYSYLPLSLHTLLINDVSFYQDETEETSVNQN